MTANENAKGKSQGFSYQIPDGNAGVPRGKGGQIKPKAFLERKKNAPLKKDIYINSFDALK